MSALFAKLLLANDFIKMIFLSYAFLSSYMSYSIYEFSINYCLKGFLRDMGRGEKFKINEIKH